MYITHTCEKVQRAVKKVTNIYFNNNNNNNNNNSISSKMTTLYTSSTDHVHEDVPDHHHGSLVVGPGGVERLQEVAVERVEYRHTHLLQ